MKTNYQDIFNGQPDLKVVSSKEIDFIPVDKDLTREWGHTMKSECNLCGWDAFTSYILNENTPTEKIIHRCRRHKPQNATEMKSQWGY